MTRKKSENWTSVVLVMISLLLFMPQSVMAGQADNSQTQQSRQDKKLNDWLSAIQDIIISGNGPAYGSAVEIAEKAVKRADKKLGGENSAESGYVLAHRSLAQTNDALLFRRMSPAQALQEIAVVYQFIDQYGDGLDAPSITILRIMAKISEARAFKAARELKTSYSLYTEVMALLETIEGGHNYVTPVEMERMFAEEL